MSDDILLADAEAVTSTGGEASDEGIEAQEAPFDQDKLRRVLIRVALTLLVVVLVLEVLRRLFDAMFRRARYVQRWWRFGWSGR